MLADQVNTAYWVHKKQRGGEEVVLGRGGAYLEGALPAWDMPGTAITEIAYETPQNPQRQAN